MKRFKSDGDQIADLCLNHYYKLGKSGKPKEDEWTTLACLINEDENGKREVIALATGTKCEVKSTIEDTIVDCHAESLLKRAFKRYLISSIKLEKKLDLNLTLLISQLPCGVIQRWQGAHQLKQHQPMFDYNHVGVHKKPGKGKLCLKPSCINKIAKWNILGLQGMKLIQFTKKPIYLDRIMIGNCGEVGEYNEDALTSLIAMNANDRRLLIDDAFDMRQRQNPKLMHCNYFRNETFMKADNKRAAASAIVMWKEGDGQIRTEIVTEGRKHGVTRSNAARNKLLISDFSITNDINSLSLALSNTEVINDNLSEKYACQWNKLKDECDMFKGWSFEELNKSDK